MKLPIQLIILLIALQFTGVGHAANQAEPANTPTDSFKQLDEHTQQLKLRVIEFNRAATKYLANSPTLAAPYQGDAIKQYDFDHVLSDYKQQHFLEAIIRYHTGRDLEVIPSQYETALQVARIYLDYGLYDYASKLFNKLLGNEDSAIASMARYQLARRDYVKQYWDKALPVLQSVTDGLPEDLMDEKRIMQGIILQQQKRHKEAIKALSAVSPGSDSYIYAQFNIAMSNLRQGWWADAEATIKGLFSTERADKKGLSGDLIDRLYIAMGYAQLQRRYFREADATLAKVSQEGVFAYKALLGRGLVAAEQGEYQQALQIMYALMDNYSGLLVTEEAHVVVPFLLESIESADVTLMYYTKSIQHYNTALQELQPVLAGLARGQYDQEFIVNSAQPAVSRAVNRPAPGAVNRYVFELMSNSRWGLTSRNYQHLNEICALLDNWRALLQRTGGYDAKIYQALSAQQQDLEDDAAKVQGAQLALLRQMVQEHLLQRQRYFQSYRNQALFGLARNYDKLLGTLETASVNGKEINGEVVRRAYQDYLANAAKDSINRRSALKRLGELQIDRYEQMLADTENTSAKAHAKPHLAEGIQLFNTLLQDYPQNVNNDAVLYQLISAYEKAEDRDGAVEAMKQLVNYYPNSTYYTQVQFKLGEEFLMGNKAIDAELAYSAALQRGDDGSVYYKRALYNRGWSRLKQSVYGDALEDFFEVLRISNYDDHRQLNRAEQDSYEDVLRAIALCFYNQGGLNPLAGYFTVHKGSVYKGPAYRKLGQIYLQQELREEAAAVYQDFISHYPTSAYAPLFSLNLIDLWKGRGFHQQEFDARRQFDRRFALDGIFWENNDIKQFTNIREALKNNVLEFSSYYHSRYQQQSQGEDLHQAKYWYERFFHNFSNDTQAGETHFLYAELLNDAGELQPALLHYDLASKFKQNTKSAEAAYAKIVTIDKLAQDSADPQQRDRWLLEKTEQAMEFAALQPADTRAAEALMHVLGKLYERKFYKKSIAVADRLFTLSASRYYPQALVVKADSLLELQSFGDAETLYRQVLAQTGSAELDRYNINERIATAIYKQGEFSAANGESKQALQHYMRVKSVAPQSTVAPLAQFDAAVLLLKQESFAEAVPILERFLREYPGHRLQSKAAQSLALAYERTGKTSQAATQLEIVAQDVTLESDTRRAALWQAAELQEQSGNTDKAQTLYARYAHTYPEPVAEAVEVYFKLAQLYQKTGPAEQVKYWYEQILSTANEKAVADNDRARYLAATAALAIAEGYIRAFKSVALVAPLKETLARKKNAMALAVDSLTKVTGYAHQQTVTEATFKIAQLYAQFGKALLTSERPPELNGDALEQYELLLEEQAIPFEEKAIEYHSLNVQLAKRGVYDQWVQNSYAVLAKLVPARYARMEKLEKFIDGPLVSANTVSNTNTLIP